MSIKGNVLNFAIRITNKFGYDLVKQQNKSRPDLKSDAHPSYKKEAFELGIDINDYQESKLGFVDSLPLLEKILFPLLNKIDIPKIIELGPGTGRWSRHIIKKLKDKGAGELTLVDHSDWIVEFLKEYFETTAESEINLKIEKCDGFKLPEEIISSSADIIFSSNTFVGLGIYFYYTYSVDFFRVLKSGGYCVFDYIDLNSEGGWNFLKQKVSEGLNYYSYYTFEAVDKIFKDSGFIFCSKHIYGKSTYLIYKKP